MRLLASSVRAALAGLTLFLASLVPVVAQGGAGVIEGRVANAATGEKVGATSQFEATADWLKTTATFDGVITSLTIRDNAFKGVAFTFTQG